MSLYKRPATGDYAKYFEGYMEHLAADGRDVLVILEEQARRVVDGLRLLPEEKADYAYALEKWSVKELVGHIIDMERLFAFRTLWVARCEANIQPGVDENLWAAKSNASSRPLDCVIEEYQTMRMSHLQLFRSLDEAALQRQGMVGGFTTTVNAMPWLAAAHESHHLAVLGERYGLNF